MKRVPLLLVLAGLVAVAAGACASAEKRERDEGWHRLHKLVLRNLRVRRPPGPAADPRVSPGGPDYVSQPLPSANFDCEPIESIYSQLDLEAIRKCLGGIPETTKASYRLRREPVPYWRLEKEKGTPACLLETLERLPVPREIVFQSRESGRMICYASRLDLEWDEVASLAVKSPLKVTRLRLEFPVSAHLADAEQVKAVLTAWSLRPFLLGEREEILSKVVPDELCRACLGQGSFIGPFDPPQRHWPEE
ncbi:MAG: hypothetical protein NDJ90_05835 [Oligoflexia bacterium]|nr:hypothetical protein [Oligoflexia bacterium]